MCHLLFDFLAKVAAKLDDIYKTGKLAHKELDERALDALREFPVEGALNVLSQFLESNLEHVSNKSAYLCGVMKTYRQKSRASQQGLPTPTATINAKGPDEEKIKKILERTGYTLDVTTGEQRSLGSPGEPPSPPPPSSPFPLRPLIELPAQLLQNLSRFRPIRTKKIWRTATELGWTDTG